MALIQCANLISMFQRMYREHWRYEWGAAETGCVDCSGAFVWAFRQFGKSIAHGSNSIARNYCEALQPISAAVPGMAAFKLHRPDQDGYNLPDKYLDSPDRNDYYHIGLVDASGEYVLNAQSVKAGFTRTKLSKWGAVGCLKAVTYTKEDQPMQTMMVNCPEGETVRLRAKPSTNDTIIAKVPSGAIVQGADYDLEWSRVDYNGRSGFMMNKYLIPVSAQPVTTPTDLVPVTLPTTGDTITLTLPRNAAEWLRDALVSALGVG
jgi:hypothetical protein